MIYELRGHRTHSSNYNVRDELFSQVVRRVCPFSGHDVQQHKHLMRMSAHCRNGLPTIPRMPTLSHLITPPKGLTDLNMLV